MRLWHCSRCNALHALIDLWHSRLTDEGRIGPLRVLCPACTALVAAAAARKVVLV